MLPAPMVGSNALQEQQGLSWRVSWTKGNERLSMDEKIEETKPEFMTADEVADWLGLNRKSVYDSANRGEMPCRKFGRRVLFSRTAILDWFKCQNQSADAETAK